MTDDIIDRHKIKMLAKIPGVPGSIWRLVHQWNPDVIENWMETEVKAGVPVEHLAFCIAEIMAVVSMGFGKCMDDPREAVVGDRGVVKLFQHQLQKKVNEINRITPGGVFLPTPGEKIGGGA